MYLIGAPHPHKADAQRLLEAAAAASERLVTDAAALQEISHRYAAIGRRDAIQPAVEALLGVVDEVLPIDLRLVERAKDIVLGAPRLSARAGLHVAAMERHRIDRIMSFDAAFDEVPGITRLGG